MDNQTIQQITGELNQVVSRVENIITKGIESGDFQAGQQGWFRWQVKDFTYDDTGVSSHRREGEHFTKPSWLGVIPSIENVAKETTEYKSTLQALATAFDEEGMWRGLDTFIRAVIGRRLHIEESPDDDRKPIVDRFLDDLLQRPVRYGAYVQLEGIALRPKEIRIAEDVSIRQTTKDDLEKEVPLWGFPMLGHDPFGSRPSAIAHIELTGKPSYKIQERVNHLIAMLRLFKVCSATCPAYDMYSESIMNLMSNATLRTGTQEAAMEKGVICESEAAELPLFWDCVADKLPTSLYEFGKQEVSPVSIAYNRYSEALVHNRPIEQRIANGVIGLEALLLEDSVELRYKLSLRTAKIIGLLKGKPLTINGVVKDAYDIRSKFAHGAELPKKEKRKLERKYAPDLKPLLLSVLDYLRRAIVVMLLTPEGKAELIKLIDASFLDRNKADELIERLSSAKEILV